MSTRIWHDTYRQDWMRAFPLGNGRIGAMVYGDPHKEILEINEESLWSGRQVKETHNASPEALARVRQLLFDGRYMEAHDLCDREFHAHPFKLRSYESFGEIFIDYFDKTPCSDYCKSLELQDAIATVTYRKGDIRYTSETFISQAYDGLVHKITTRGGRFSCNITMERNQDAFTSALDAQTLVEHGILTYMEEEKYGAGGEGLSFGARLRIFSDGKQSCDKHSVTVEDASWVILYGAFATNYDPALRDVNEQISYRAQLEKTMAALCAADLSQLRQQHIDSHRQLFDRVEFALDAPTYEDVPTDLRLKRVQEGAYDPDLFVLHYHFGRYLLLESAGKNSRVPPNLQGIWCNGTNPPWGSDYHLNINLQMNYWPADPCNLPEVIPPFLQFMKTLREYGAVTARELYGARGWVAHLNSNIFGITGIHDSTRCGCFPMAGPWLCLNLWEHYEYCEDLGYLQQIYPIMKGACEFVQDYLVPGKDGYLVTAPSNSPENFFLYDDPDGTRKKCMFGYAPTVDFQIIHALFTRMAHACRMLGRDEEFAQGLQKTLTQLPPMQVSRRYGTLCEWLEDFEEGEPGHRHISHLFGVHPSDQITREDPVLWRAARNTLQRRLDHGGAGTGWSRAWVINFFARFQEGEQCLEHLQKLLQISTAENLFDVHPPFQIDGNFGAVAGINEMLLQSHFGKPGQRILELLPAIPKAWSAGHVRGIKARGNLLVDMAWQESRLTQVKITACGDTVLRLKLPRMPVSLPEGASVEGDLLVLPMQKEAVCRLIF